MPKKNDGKKPRKKVRPKLSADEKRRRAAMERLRKATGQDESMLHFGSQVVSNFDVISTGFEELDQLISPEVYKQTGKGGVPRGYLCEFFGPEMGGKSTLCLMLAASVTSNGGMVCWIDAESSYQKSWADAQGVNNDDIFYFETGETGEQFINAAVLAAASGDYELVVIDSLAALEPEQLMDAELTDEPRVGAKARMMSRSCPRLVAAAKKGNCAIIFINQLRMMIGQKWGNPETTPGGKALRFYASLRLRISQLGKAERYIMKGGEQIGLRANISVAKTRFSPPGWETVLPIYYSKDAKPLPLDMLLDLGMRTKLIRCRTRNDVCYFTLDGSKEIKSIAGFDEFKYELTADPNNIRELARRITEEKGKPLDGDVRRYVETIDEEHPTEGDD